MIDYLKARVNLRKNTLEFKGITFDMYDLMCISMAYKRMCSAEYIQENVPDDISETEIWRAACALRDIIESEEMTDDDALPYLAERGLK